MMRAERDERGIGARLRERKLGCVEVVEEFLAVVEQDSLHAWAAIDGDRLLAAAGALDAVKSAERAGLPLFGIPVGVKDNFDTAELPTAYGSPIYDGWRPPADAEAVRRLRAAGALIAGKTKLAEFAWMHPPDTVSPIDPARTPGGSSTGSAVAVAAGHVALATGTQTAGSVNRPASYCGVVGYKPTFGLISTAGIKPLAASLDTVGVFARTVAEARLIANALLDDPGALEPSSAPPLAPRLGFARTPLWDRVDSAARAAIEHVVAGLEGTEPVELPAGFPELVTAQEEIQLFAGARALAPEAAWQPDLLSDELRQAIAAGAAISDERHRENLAMKGRHGPALVAFLARYDGVLVPSATGVPPIGRETTGDPVFSRAWSLIGAPSVSLPLAWTHDGLPAAIQLVGAPGRDGALLDAAASLYR